MGTPFLSLKRTFLWIPALLLMTFTGVEEAQAKGGVGLHVGGLNGRDASGFDARALQAGVEGVGYMGGRFRGPELRLSGELNGLSSPYNGGGVQGGVAGDVVFTHLFNADLYAGLGVGFTAGPALLGPNSGGAGAYMRPELGCQWNLGRMAVNARLELVVLPGGPEAVSPAHYAGLSVGLLFGDFSPFQKAERRPGPRGPNRPDRPNRPGRRVIPPPPPPPRS